jgi:hypothetical protein
VTVAGGASCAPRKIGDLQDVCRRPDIVTRLVMGFVCHLDRHRKYLCRGRARHCSSCAPQFMKSEGRVRSSWNPFLNSRGLNCEVAREEWFMIRSRQAHDRF